MKNYPLIAAVTGALLMAGCQPADRGQEGAKAPAPSPQSAAPSDQAKDAVAVVNGKPISKVSVEMVQADLGQRRGGANIPEEEIVDQLIKRELLRQEAEKQQMSKDEKIAARLDNAERMVLSQVAAERFIAQAPVSEEELKKAYDQQVGSTRTTEFRASHILVDSEQAAKNIIAKLQKGEKFADLAKKLSKDPGSKDKGGELGWFAPQRMVPPFSEAVMALKNGEYTKTPVQTQFGWHVILREDSREQAPPPFDAVKDQLRSFVQTQKLQQHIADLTAAAKIERRTPEPKPEAPPASGSPDAGKAPPSPPPATDTKPEQAAPR
ncbi:peptidylprolyl isomerase [Candidatus Methylocalor cossyra]|uniref:peptidylprolyl isomerase n=1 Tax=Candidatus Methylocalor cossyra TaxID=3108543 RepID=A0ABP1C733_9GAMM